MPAVPSSHLEDVIYSRKYGTALTLDVFTPQQNPLGVGVLAIISGGWNSSHEAISNYQPILVDPLVARGYTVFAVVTSSQPKFTIPEIVGDVHRAVRFVRHYAATFDIAPNVIGIAGYSAGGHLSLLVGFTGMAGYTEAEDAVERESSQVQAIGEFYGPTDFFNYGADGVIALGQSTLRDYRAPFDFHEWNDDSGRFLPVSTERRFEIGKEISPINHVGASTPPTCMIHGDIDELVPLQQSEILAARLREFDVPHQLHIKQGGDHGWEDCAEDAARLADWFDLHLAAKPHAL